MVNFLVLRFQPPRASISSRLTSLLPLTRSGRPTPCHYPDHSTHSFPNSSTTSPRTRFNHFRTSTAVADRHHHSHIHHTLFSLHGQLPMGRVLVLRYRYSSRTNTQFEDLVGWLSQFEGCYWVGLGGSGWEDGREKGHFVHVMVGGALEGDDGVRGCGECGHFLGLSFIYIKGWGQERNHKSFTFFSAIEPQTPHWTQDRLSTLSQSIPVHDPTDSPNPQCKSSL